MRHARSWAMIVALLAGTVAAGVILALRCHAQSRPSLAPGGATDTQANDNPAAKPVTIPIDEIWANEGREGRRLRDLEPDLFIYRDTPENIKKYSSPQALQEAVERSKQSLVIPIERAMARMRATEKAKPRHGFAVAGIGRDALQGVHDVLVEGHDPSEFFRTGCDITIVFFSLPGPGVTIDRVERKKQVISIYYVMHSGGKPAHTWNLSLVPVGKLSPGKYHVRMIRVPEKERRHPAFFPPIEPGRERDVVCRPFSFVVAAAKRFVGAGATG